MAALGAVALNAETSFRFESSSICESRPVPPERSAVVIALHGVAAVCTEFVFQTEGQPAALLVALDSSHVLS